MAPCPTLSWRYRDAYRVLFSHTSKYFTHLAFYLTVTWTQILPLPFLHPTTPHRCSSVAQHFAGRFPQLSIRSWPMPQHVIHTELGPASQYFSTILTTPPNRRPDAQSCFASVSPLTVIKLAEPRLFRTLVVFWDHFHLWASVGASLTVYRLMILLLVSVVPSFLHLVIFLETFHVPLIVANAPVPLLILLPLQLFLQLQ